MPLTTRSPWPWVGLLCATATAANLCRVGSGPLAGGVASTLPLLLGLRFVLGG